MLDGAVVRDYQPSDFERVKELHEASGIDYQLPDLSSPLFLVTKVVELDGIVRAAGGLYLQCETYLWLDYSDWASPEAKLESIKLLDRAGMQEAWLRGIDCACLWLPPGMDRFGERLVEDLGFIRDRDGWVSYSKRTK
jgi:hypothetical protein